VRERVRGESEKQHRITCKLASDHVYSQLLVSLLCGSPFF
jgi:hypothetical protein